MKNAHWGRDVVIDSCETAIDAQSMIPYKIGCGLETLQTIDFKFCQLMVSELE